MLFDGKNIDEWVPAQNRTPARWIRRRRRDDGEKGAGVGNIETKRFKDYSCTSNGRFPANITGTGQGRGNSGLFLASTGPGDDGYELQILDSYNNKTYVNGQAGSIYKQAHPLVNPNRKPGEWQTYDIVWTAPVSTPMARSGLRRTSRSSSTGCWCRITSS